MGGELESGRIELPKSRILKQRNFQGQPEHVSTDREIVAEKLKMMLNMLECLAARVFLIFEYEQEGSRKR